MIQQITTHNNTKGKVNLFYLAYMLLVIRELIIGLTNIDDLVSSSILRVISLSSFYIFIAVVFLIILKMRCITFKELIVFISIISIFLVSGYTSGSNLLFEGLLLILCSKNVNFDEFNKFSLKVLVIVTFCIVFLALLGFIGLSVQYRSYDSTVIRYGLGFGHPNSLGIIIFQFVAQYLYANRIKHKNTKYIFCIFILILFYVVTNSNTMIIASMIMIMSMFIYENFIERGLRLSKDAARKLLITIMIIGIITVILVARYYWLYPEELTMVTLRSRLRLAVKYINAYGIDWFGHHIVSGSYVKLPGYSAGYSYLDNSYVWLLVRYGILTTASIVIVYILYYGKLIRENDWIMLIISVSYLFYAFSETTVFRITCNVFFVHIGIILYQRKVKKL